jgi:hypothetical protein
MPHIHSFLWGEFLMENREDPGDSKSLKDTCGELRWSLSECARLRKENVRLKRLLSVHGITLPPEFEEMTASLRAETAESHPTVSDKSAPGEKIALFRTLFRGREDVYAVRWESPNGRSGYLPASIRDWKAVLSSRPADRKRIDKKTRKLLPFTHEVVEKHLKGEQTIGIYPLLPNETCWFLAVDFDKKGWQLDASAFLATCRGLNVPAALERSRSGNGGHVWIFFDQPVAAVMARKLGCLILTHTMEHRHQVGLDSYDRFFPNQDTVPRGGFGNLIALPLQKIPRQAGNSVFVDTKFRPYPDQWSFLASLQRMRATAVEELVRKATRTGEIIGVRMSLTTEESSEDPWTLPPSGMRTERPVSGPLPERARIVRANLLYIEKDEMPSAMLNRLFRLAAFQNPVFYKAQAMRLSTFNKPRVIACGEDLPRHIALPAAA